LAAGVFLALEKQIGILSIFSNLMAFGGYLSEAIGARVE